MKVKKFFAVMLAVLVATLCLTSCDEDFWEEDSGGDYDDQSQDWEPSELGTGGAGQRSYRVKTKGGGEDTVTLMLYLCGSDLESEDGAATSDLEEIMNADISGKLNIVAETGGAYEWQNDYVDPDTNERWLITNAGPKFLEDVGKKDMSKGSTLTDFIKFSVKNYPADRYMLVLWDHGGGTVDGYAYDERFRGENMMPISELNQALSNAGVVFDMIGFDCCLMGTAETAFMVEKYADFMVASQRVEPGDGWHYTPWIESLSQNTSIPTAELGKIIVDSFIKESAGGDFGEELTLSVIDLTYIPGLFDEMNRFFAAAQKTLVQDKTFVSTSHLLSSSRAITDNDDLVDLAFLIGNMDGSDELLAMLDKCVVYNGATIKNHNGLCLYFPYSDLKKVSSALDIFDQIGIDEEYQGFITAFANIMVGGQVHNNGGANHPLGGEEYAPEDWTELGWVDEDYLTGYEDFFEEYSYDDSELEIIEKGDEYVLSLSDDEWELITDIVQWVYLDDGEGYIELGADSVYEFDDDGDLLISFDNTWVSLDGQLVCFYTAEDVDDGDGDTWYNYGNVPVLYNDRYAEIVIRWDNKNPTGYVAGWRYTDTGSGGSQRGLFELKNGMTFEFLCDYYTYDGDFDDEYLCGELTVNGTIEVSYEDVGDDDVEVFYELIDIYGNSYWTESVVYSVY